MRTQWAAYAGWIEEALGDGRAFPSGQACGLADISAYMNVWFLTKLCPAEAGIAKMLARSKPVDVGNGLGPEPAFTPPEGPKWPDPRYCREERGKSGFVRANQRRTAPPSLRCAVVAG